MTFFNFSSNKKENFIQSIASKMDKMGLKCSSLGDDAVVISTAEGDFVARIWNTPDRGRRRINFVHRFALNDMENLSEEGKAVLVSACNNNAEFTVTQFMDGAFLCYVSTSVASVSDFVREFRFAKDEIKKICETMAYNMPDFLKSYPKPLPRRPIGYITTANSEESSDEKGLAAWSEMDVVS